MIHEISSGVRGSHTDIQNDATQTKKLNERFLRVLAKNSIKSLKFIKDKMKKSGNVDWYLTAKEAKDLGIIDHVGIPLLVTTK
jgi:ATP-dependent protease ClpP protease subunit